MILFCFFLMNSDAIVLIPRYHFQWVGKIDLSVLNEEEEKRAEAMRERLLKMAEESGEVGYSLDG